MTSLSLHLLGPFQADLDSQAMTDFRTRKVQALLIYLATETQAHQRDLLLDLLWPGLPERSARSNLRQTIYYLRQIFPDPPDNGQPIIIVNRQDIQLNPQADVNVDVNQFQALLDQSQAHNHLDLFLCADCRRRRSPFTGATSWPTFTWTIATNLRNGPAPGGPISAAGRWTAWPS